MSPKLKSWLLLGGIFVIGLVTGSALTIGLGPPFLHPPMDRDMKKHWLAHLTDKLALTANQQAKVEPILADAAEKLHGLARDEKQRGAQIFKSADDQIAALLTPDQQAKLQKMEEEREKMFGGHMHPFGHGGPGDRMPPPSGAPSSSTP
jgi:Spy/CpxP family protein refolding chaperone